MYCHTCRQVQEWFWVHRTEEQHLSLPSYGSHAADLLLTQRVDNRALANVRVANEPNTTHTHTRHQYTTCSTNTLSVSCLCGAAHTHTHTCIYTHTLHTYTTHTFANCLKMSMSAPFPKELVRLEWKAMVGYSDDSCDFHWLLGGWGGGGDARAHTHTLTVTQVGTRSHLLSSNTKCLCGFSLQRKFSMCLLRVPSGSRASSTYQCTHTHTHTHTQAIGTHTHTHTQAIGTHTHTHTHTGHRHTHTKTQY